MTDKTRLENHIREIYARIQGRLDAIQSLVRAYQAQTDQTFSQNNQIANRNFQQTIQRVNTEFQAVQEKVRADLKSIFSSQNLEALAWESSKWSSYLPVTSEFPPEFIRIGELMPGNLSTPMPAMPALVPLMHHGHWLINSDEQGLRAAIGLVNSTAWRIAAFTKPGMGRFILLDPHDLGGSLASLRSLPAEVRGTDIYYQEDDILRVLTATAKEIASIKIDKLSANNMSVAEYNRRFPEMPIFYRFIIVTGFPVGFNQQSLESLRQILFSGPDAGVYVILLQKTNIRLPYDFNPTTFFTKCFQVNMVGSSRCQVANDKDLQGMEIKLDIPPALGTYTLIAKHVERLAPSVVTNKVEFLKIAERKANWWNTSSSKGLFLDLGKNESGQLHRVEVGGTAIHALIGGATGYGKSTLLHTMILMLATRYGPDQLELYLVDFKEGVEFEDYVTHDLPQARAVVVEAEREFGLSVLDYIVQEMETRGKQFKKYGVSSIDEYVSRANQSMQRVVLVVDEFIRFFEEDDQISELAQQQLGKIIKLGRAFGIHVILAAQRPVCGFISTNEIRSQIGLRIALKTFVPDDSEMILGEGNYASAQIEAHRKGLACVTIDPYRKDVTEKVQTAFLSPKVRKAYLEEIKICACNHKFQRQQQMIVFHKKEPAIWTQNGRIKNRLASNNWKVVRYPFFYLGEPIRILPDHVRAELKKDTDENLIIDGKDAVLAQRILLSALLGIMVSAVPDKSQIVFISHNEPQDPINLLVEIMSKAAGFQMKVLSGSDANNIMMELGAELERRENTPGSADRRVFILINGAHRWNAIRSREKYTTTEAGEQLLNLVQHGSQHGIHILCWTDRLESLARILNTGAPDVSTLFNHRVALKIDEDESIQILGNMAAKKLPTDPDCERAYYQANLGGPMEKFKPYQLPSADEMRSISQQICAKWSQK